MKDISIEYAHIYTNNKIDKEHETSLVTLGKIQDELRHQSLSLVVMVDDYSFPDPTFDYESFVSWLSKKGFKPDLVFRESQLIPLCDQVIRMVNDNELKEQLVDYIKSKKYPCSLFISTWYLLRLGHLKSDSFSEDLSAKQLINILPRSFKPFEDKAMEIIKATEFHQSVDAIKNMYIKGRLLA